MSQLRRMQHSDGSLVTRQEYPNLPRHTIRIASWANDPANVGVIVRLAEAYLVEEVCSVKKPARSSAVGTDRWQPFTVGEDMFDFIARAQADDYTVIALEQTERSIPMDLAIMPERLCLLVGNESLGVPAEALALADGAIEIRQFGFVGSLNVATAVAIALYEWGRQVPPSLVEAAYLSDLWAAVEAA